MEHSAGSKIYRVQRKDGEREELISKTKGKAAGIVEGIRKYVVG